MPAKDKYSDPKLRDQVKEEVQQSDKRGAPGQWSARKAQFMASEYKKRGGTYNTDPSEKEESQKNLSKWTEEEWQTKEGGGSAKKGDGTRKRYLPKKAWENMDDTEKEETEVQKLDGSKKGKQFVRNTGKAKNARKGATKGKEEDDNDEEQDDEEEGGEEPEKEQREDEEDAEDDKAEQPADENEETEEKAKVGQKRSRQTKSANTSAKRQKANGDDKKDSNKKTMGSKHDTNDPPAAQASAKRLPKKGQTVSWKAMPGWVQGEVVEVVKKDKKIENGKQVKATKDDPRIVLKSHGPSGKIAVHKPEAVYFD